MLNYKGQAHLLTVHPVQNEKAATRLYVAGIFLIYLVLFAITCIGVQLYTGAYCGDLSRTGDEAAHFVNSVMIRDYVAYNIGSNPLRFALDYYSHLPRVSIGHWPPFFHLVQSGVFLLTEPSIVVAIGFQALIAGTAAAVAASLVRQRAGCNLPGALVGLVTGSVILASPDLLRNLSTVMLDTFLAVLVLLTALAWAAYVRTTRTLWSVMFAGFASAAILTKGNAYGLGLLPVLYVALSGQFALFTNWRTWLSAGIVLALTVPWYALTYKISSDGFVYSWGLDYTTHAFFFYAKATLGIFGPVSLIGFAIGTMVFTRRAWRGLPDELTLACASAAIGLFLFQLIAPADLASRYLIAALPAAMVVAGVGLLTVLSGIHAGAGTRPAWLPCIAVALCLLGNTTLAFQAPNVSSTVMSDTARDMMASPDPAPLVLVASGPYGEGGLIAAFAALDRRRAHYIVRASKAFASSNFMGSVYQARFESLDDVNRWIKDHRIAWVIHDSSANSMAMLHNRQLGALADAGQSGWRLISERRQPSGSVRLFRLDGAPATPAEVAAVLAQVAPTKVIGSNISQ